MAEIKDKRNEFLKELFNFLAIYFGGWEIPCKPFFPKFGDELLILYKDVIVGELDQDQMTREVAQIMANTIFHFHMAITEDLL